MTQDEIIRMAREAGDTTIDERGREEFVFDDHGIKRFAALVAEATKEKAAKVCEELENPKDDLSAYSDGWIGGTFDCAAAIRGMK